MLRQIWVRLVRLIGSEGAGGGAQEDAHIWWWYHCATSNITLSWRHLKIWWWYHTPSIHTVPFMIFGVGDSLRALTSQQYKNVQCHTKFESFSTYHISLKVRDNSAIWGLNLAQPWRVERVEEENEDVTIFMLRIFCADFCLSWCISGCQVGTDVKFLWNANCVAPSGCPPVKSKVVAKVYAIMYFFSAFHLNH